MLFNMCGIAGLAGPMEREHAEAAIDAMTGRLAHRGPDAAGRFIDEGIALGHRRLSIIDLSESADQPMSDTENRFIITFNGEIYNFGEVRERMPEYPFRTASDTETILAAYARFGSDCLAMLNGMFAFAIWDRLTRELFLARDRMGVKPLYYCLTGRNLVFASEIRSVLASGLADRTIDRAGLRDYLAFQSVYSPGTIVAGIRQLPAGCWAKFGTGGLRTGRYWSIDGRRGAFSEKSAPEVRERIRGLLENSVKRRLVSDVRLGAFLSGGIDSSAIVALMSRISDSPVSTFSVNFEEPEFDESVHAETIAKRFGTDHQSVRLGAGDFLESLPAALAGADSPSGDGVNTYVVSKATRAAGLKVALSGVGGDELFAGYPNFINWLKFRRGAVSRTPRIVRRAAGAVLALSANSKHQRIGAVLESGNGIEHFYPRTRQVLSDRLICELEGGKPDTFNITKELAGRAAAIAEFPLLSQFSIAEFLGYTQNVLLKDADQFSMASALEVREPFFDYELVEYVLEIPDEYKYPDFPKRLLVDSLAPLLPDSIVHRPKMGFVLPWEKWMRAELREFCEARIAALAGRALLDPGRLTRLWDDFSERRSGVLWSHVWHLVVLSDWLDTNRF